MYMKKTYITKIYSRNHILDHMLLSVPKIYVQMIPKINDPFLGSSCKNEPFFSPNILKLNRDKARNSKQTLRETYPTHWTFHTRSAFSLHMMCQVFLAYKSTPFFTTKTRDRFAGYSCSNNRGFFPTNLFQSRNHEMSLFMFL